MARALARPAEATAGFAGGSGATCALVAFALYSAMDVILQQLAGRYHPFQVGFLNALFAFAPFLLITARAGWGRLRTTRPRLHMARGVLSILGTACNSFALANLALADAYAVLFAAPILVAALAVPLLGERAGAASWAAIGVGFAGVMLMLQPDGALWSVGGIAAIAAAICNAAGALLVRYMQHGETREAISIYGNLASCLGLGLTLPFLFVLPSLADLALSAAGGLIAGCAYLFLLRAYRAAPAATIAPCQYTQMPYALVLGFTVHGTLPETPVLIGAAVVIASGLVILRRPA